MDVISNFIVLEGCDGSGTTTQLNILSDRMENEFKGKVRFFPTTEPADDQLGALIKNILDKDHPLKVKPETLAMLFAANRNEHLYGKHGILEHVNKGAFVASDRYVLSSLAYQGLECGDELPALLNSFFPIPEITFFLDVQPEIAISRIRKNRSSFQIYEFQDFQEKVHKKYKAAIENYRASGARVEVIDASKNTTEVAEQIWSILKGLPILNIQ